MTHIRRLNHHHQYHYQIVGCHNLTQQSSRSQVIKSKFLQIIILMILIFIEPTLSNSSEKSSSNFMFSELSNAVEDDELSKTLDRSGNEEWNLNQIPSGNSGQLPPVDEGEKQFWLPNNKNQEDERNLQQNTTTTTEHHQNFEDYPNQEPNKRNDNYPLQQEEQSNSDIQPTDGDLTGSGNQFISVVNNQSNIIGFNEPLDVIKYSSSERSTSFTGGSGSLHHLSGNQSTQLNNNTFTKYGWKSSHNNDPIVSIIKLNNNTSSNLPRMIHLNDDVDEKTDKLNITQLASGELKLHNDERFKPNRFADLDEFRPNNHQVGGKKIYKSYSIRKNNPVIENGTASNRMISYSPRGVIISVASKPTVNHHHLHQKVAAASNHKHQKILRAPLIITEDQLKMIAESEDHSPEPNNHEDFIRNQLNSNTFRSPEMRPTKDSFMFDASLLPMALSLMSGGSNSGGVSASELIPQTASYMDQPTPFETDFKKLQQSGQGQERQSQKISFLSTANTNTNFAADDNIHHQHLQGAGYKVVPQIEHEPIVVETSPEASSLKAGSSSSSSQSQLPGTAHITITNDVDNDDSSSGSENSDASQEPFDSLNGSESGDDSPATSDELTPNSPIDSADESVSSMMNKSNKKPIKSTQETTTTKISTNISNQRNRKKEKEKANNKKQVEKTTIQKQQTSNSKRHQPEQELLVGPFKSESEAPATITLAGIVYQKSGSSSSIVKSVVPSVQSNSIQALKLGSNGSADGGELTNVGKNRGSSIKQTTSSKVSSGNELTSAQGDKFYWPYSSSGYVQPTSASKGTQQQLASVSDILLGSIKGDSTTVHSGDGSTIPQASSTATYTSSSSNDNGAIRLSPFSFSSGGALLSSNNNNNNNNNNNQLLQLDSTSLVDSLELLSPPRELINKLNFKDSNTMIAPEAVSSAMLLDSSTNFGPMTSASSLSSSGQEVNSPPVWASSSKKGEQYFLGSFQNGAGPILGASTDNSFHHHHQHQQQHKEKSGPIVIVQKDVKPMKYHLLKAYLKLRRLLRPFEATYLFPNDPAHSFMKRTFGGSTKTTTTTTNSQVVERKQFNTKTNSSSSAVVVG